MSCNFVSPFKVCARVTRLLLSLILTFFEISVQVGFIQAPIDCADDDLKGELFYGVGYVRIDS